MSPYEFFTTTAPTVGLYALAVVSLVGILIKRYTVLMYIVLALTLFIVSGLAMYTLGSNSIGGVLAMAIIAIIISEIDDRIDEK